MDFHFEVTGKWPFPTDMLRRDMAVAATPEDQKEIDRLSGDHAPDRAAMRVDTTIKLVIPDAGRQRPLTERWRSFGWDVPGDGSLRPDAKEAARRMRAEALRQSARAKLTAEEWDAVRLYKR